jgi:anti-sigma regulatory factor (Ser/Thr protein kinase)
MHMKQNARIGRGHIELIVPLTPDYVKVVRMAIAGLGSILRLESEEIENLKLAAGEACYCILYGPAASPGRISVNACASGETLTLEIRQQGAKIGAYGAQCEDDHTMEREIAGILLEQLMDTVEHAQDGACCCIVMTRAITP